MKTRDEMLAEGRRCWLAAQEPHRTLSERAYLLGAGEAFLWVLEEEGHTEHAPFDLAEIFILNAKLKA